MVPAAPPAGVRVGAPVPRYAPAPVIRVRVPRPSVTALPIVDPVIGWGVPPPGVWPWHPWQKAEGSFAALFASVSPSLYHARSRAVPGMFLSKSEAKRS